ncbi:MAG: hypothetical protein LBE55_02035, partial [Clostridiales bacterium]|nr:hypothetical protein [Clostridiales bacterium]
MKISKMVRIFVAVFVTLSICTVTLTLLSSNANEDVERAFEEQAEYRELGLQLMNASDFLTQMAQHYVQFGDRYYYDAYWYEVEVAQNRGNAIARLAELGAPQNELDLITRAGEYSTTLIILEERAFAYVAESDFDTARYLMFGPLYE